jgi:hypothetical protein
VHQLARKINKRKEPGVLLKLDLARAFDTLSWSFLFETLEKMGFPKMVRRWISIAFCSASTRVLVNGVPGRRISHARGLRQGDPLSSLLFMLAMEVKTALLSKATELGMLSPIGNCSATQRVSIYADDVVIFIKPTVQDLVVIRELMSVFGAVSGLQVNYRKTSATLIRARDHDEELVTQLLNCTITQFPIKYLGLQLALRPLTKSQWQPMLDATVKILPGWQRGLIARLGRLVLVKAVISARPVHQMLVAEAPGWLLDEVDRCCRGLFWSDKDKAHGGQCLVAWNQVCKPLEYGGLGVKNLRLQGLALRVRWEWLRRTDPSRPWQGLPTLTDSKARDVFDSLVQIKVGDGLRVLFWRDRWIDGKSVRDIAPVLMGKVKTRSYNARTVAQGLTDHRWVLDISGALSEPKARECTRLWLAINSISRDTDMADQFCWPWSRAGVYTARSTYKMLSLGNCTHPLGHAIWRNRATPKSKLFVWLAQHGRIWSSDRRFRHGLQDHARPCEVCLQETETSEHILLQCVVAREVWHICRHQLDLDFEEPTRTSTFEDWWTRERNRLRGLERKEFDALVCTVSYALWKNRNAWTFGDVRRQHRPITLAALVTEEYNIIRSIRRGAGAGPSPTVGVGATFLGE